MRVVALGDCSLVCIDRSKKINNLTEFNRSEQRGKKVFMTKGSILGTVLVSAVLAACGAGDSMSDINQSKPTDNAPATSAPTEDREELIRATGLWELTKRDLAPEDTHSVPTKTAAGISVASVSRIGAEGIDDCGALQGQETATLTVRRFVGDSFEVGTAMNLVDVFSPEVSIADVTGDGSPEILVTSWCYAGNVRAFGFDAARGDWTEMPPTGASSFENGILKSISKDCQPYCAEGGYETQKVEWTGSAFKTTDLIDANGNIVNLSVTETCAKFRPRKALPLSVCDRGPLAEKFITLARRTIGDFGEATISTASDRITPAVAKWIKEYKYRHQLEITAVVDQTLFETLGNYWGSDTSEGYEELFDSYCEASNSSYECSSYKYLFPTDQCPDYRPAYEQVLPLKKCDFGPWVGMAKDALFDFDGIASEEGWPSALFDTEFKDRIKAYQQARGLEVDGLIGTNTWNALVGVEGERPGGIIPH